VSEPLIQIRGRERLFVQLPGVADPDRAVALLGDTAQLEFRKGLVPVHIPVGAHLDKSFAGGVGAVEHPL